MIKKFLILFVCLFGFSSVYAESSEQCQGITRYVDYSDVYQSIYNDSTYRQFYTDFKDWFDSQSTYSDYMILRQIGANNTYYNRIFLYNNLSNLNPKYYHYLSNYGNYFRFFITTGVSSRNDIGYFNFSSDVFDSSLITTCNLQDSGSSCLYNGDYSYFYSSYPSFDNINDDIYSKKFTWVIDDSSNVYKNSYILIDSTFNLPISFATGNQNYFTSFKLNDLYYCVGDSVPSVNDIFPFSGGGNVDPDPEPEPEPTPVFSLELYDKSIDIIGNLPQEYSIVYFIVSLVLLVGLFVIIFCPIIFLVKKFKN